MCKKAAIFIFLFFIFCTSFSQNVLLHQDVEDTVISKWGANLKNYSHVYFGLGSFVGRSENAGSKVLYEKSYNIYLGLRYKFKICNFFSSGLDLAYNSYSYAISQSSQKAITDKLIHKKEKISSGNIGGNVYLRFNFDKRGNTIGNFLDVGAYGEYKMFSSNIYKEENLDGNLVKTKIRNLQYLTPLNYGLNARIGFNRYVIYGNYRLSDIFESSYNYPEFPRITIGLQIGFHK